MSDIKQKLESIQSKLEEDVLLRENPTLWVGRDGGDIVIVNEADRGNVGGTEVRLNREEAEQVLNALQEVL